MAVELDENGKLNGLRPIFNDVCAFVNSKIKSCEFQKIVDVACTYFLTEELKEAREVIYSLVDPNGIRKLPRLRSRADIAHAIVYHLKENLDQLKCIFIALDLNRIPYLDAMDDESVALFLERYQVQNQLQEVLSEQAAVKEQVDSIAPQLIRIEEAKKTKNAQVSIPRSPSSGRSQPSQAQPDKAQKTQTTRDDMMQQNVDNAVRS